MYSTMIVVVGMCVCLLHICIHITCKMHTFVSCFLTLLVSYCCFVVVLSLSFCTICCSSGICCQFVFVAFNMTLTIILPAPTKRTTTTTTNTWNTYVCAYYLCTSRLFCRTRLLVFLLCYFNSSAIP